MKLCQLAYRTPCARIYLERVHRLVALLHRPQGDYLVMVGMSIDDEFRPAIGECRFVQSIWRKAFGPGSRPRSEPRDDMAEAGE